jgi:threonine dehydratase
MPTFFKKKYIDLCIQTPMTKAHRMSRRLNNSILLKREDLQASFSFESRGIYNHLKSLKEPEAAARFKEALAIGMEYSTEMDNGSLQTMAGLGTIAVEILRQCPTAEYIFVPVLSGSRSLLNGVVTYIRRVNPCVKVFGVQFESNLSTEDFLSEDVISVSEDNACRK